MTKVTAPTSEANSLAKEATANEMAFLQELELQLWRCEAEAQGLRKLIARVKAVIADRGVL